MAKTHKLPRAVVERAQALLESHENELVALLAACHKRASRDEGVPAVLVVEDFLAGQRTACVPALADEPLREHYAALALALAILVEASGGDPYYPSICPAMSAIAEQAFALLPEKAWQDGQVTS